MSHFASTGEPPTIDSLASSQEDDSPFQTMENVRSQQKRTNQSSSSLTPQEADSGYEASPSSTNDNCTFSFDDGRQTTSEDIVNPPEDSFEDSSEQILMMSYSQEGEDSCKVDGEDESEVDEDLAEDNSESSRWFVESSTTVVAADADNECESGRPSSLPIPIPIGGDDSRIRSVNQRLQVRSLPSPVAPEIPSPLESPELTFTISPVPLRLSMRLPQSWPTRTSAAITNLRPLTIGGIPLEIAYPSLRPMPARPMVPRARSRRKLIDSDASSVTSSEGDAMEEVFEDAEPPNVVSSAPNANGRLFLPDVVPHASPAGMARSVNSNGVRRCRSISINLPLEEAVVEVGRSLRRLSDQFNDEIRLRRSRRYTISEIIRINIRSLNPNARLQRDSDDDGDSIFNRRS